MTRDEAIEFLLSNPNKYVPCTCPRGRFGTDTDAGTCTACLGNGVVKNEDYIEACKATSTEPEYNDNSLFTAVAEHSLNFKLQKLIGSPFDNNTVEEIAERAAKHFVRSTKRGRRKRKGR